MNPRPAPPAATVRLCLVSDAFQLAYGGGVLRFQRYLPGLQERGIEVRVFTGTPTSVKARLAGTEPYWAPVAPGTLLPPESVAGIPVDRVRLPEGAGALRTAALFRALHAHCRAPGSRPDVLQFLSLPYAAWPWLLRLRWRGVRIVLASTIVPPRAGRARRFLQRQVQYAPLRLADCVVAGSDAMTQSMRQLGYRGRVERIPHGVDLSRFRPPADEAERRAAREAVGIEPGAQVVLCVGGVSSRKGVDLLMEAWAQIARARPEAQLLFVGPRRDRDDPGHQAFGERLEALRQASGAAERVRFVGMVQHPELYFRAADVLAFTSHREGVPNVVLEAMASALPVVTTPFIGLSPEIGAAGRTYRMVERDAAALAAAIGGLLRERDHAAALGREGRRWVEEHADLNDVLDRYAALYRELAGLTSPAGAGTPPHRALPLPQQPESAHA